MENVHCYLAKNQTILLKALSKKELCQGGQIETVLGFLSSVKLCKLQNIFFGAGHGFIPTYYFPYPQILLVWTLLRAGGIIKGKEGNNNENKKA